MRCIGVSGRQFCLLLPKVSGEHEHVGATRIISIIVAFPVISVSHVVKWNANQHGVSAQRQRGSKSIVNRAIADRQFGPLLPTRSDSREQIDATVVIRCRSFRIIERGAYHREVTLQRDGASESIDWIAIVGCALRLLAPKPSCAHEKIRAPGVSPSVDGIARWGPNKGDIPVQRHRGTEFVTGRSIAGSQLRLLDPVRPDANEHIGASGVTTSGRVVRRRTDQHSVLAQ